MEGYVSYRDSNSGSWSVQNPSDYAFETLLLVFARFVESICKAFMEYAGKKELKHLLDKVAGFMKQKRTPDGFFQSCSYESIHFYKEVYFNPGWSR